MTNSQKKILVAEDDPNIAKLICMRLEVNGYDAILARDGEEAIQKARAEKPALLVLDLMLPKITGYEVCQMLKFDEQHKGMPIIILTALSEQHERDKAIESGADAYFIKPFDLKLLITKIQEFVG